MTINLHIDRIVFDGLSIDPRRAGEVRASIESELSRLFDEGEPIGLLASGGAMPTLPAAPITVAPPSSRAGGLDPVALGVQIARSVHGGLGS